MGRKSTAPLPGETKQEKFGLQGEEETQPRTMVGSLTTAEMFRQLQGRMAAVLKELHRMMGGHVQPQHKQKISNLIIMKIYQRDIIDRLIKEQVHG